MIQRPRPTERDYEQRLDRFLSQVDTWFSDMAAELRPDFASEPNRLIEKREYRAAVISAYSLLETTFRRVFAAHGYKTDSRRPLSTRQLIQLAQQNELFVDAGVSSEKIDEWTTLRNKAVHTNDTISAQRAKRVVAGIAGLLARLR